MLAPTVAHSSRHRGGIDTLRRSCGCFIFLTFLLCYGPPISQCQAQAFGTCEHGEAEAFLDVNNVRAIIYNTGVLFWKGSGNIYTVPKDGKANAIFLKSLWLSGIVEHDILFAGTAFGPWEFWPGPLDDMGNPPIDCTKYDRIYSIYRDSLIFFEETGIPTQDLIDWPAELGAPIIDGDGIKDNYNLEGGGRPALVGDQMLWWIMNDAGNKKEWRRTLPFLLEVHVTAFAFNTIEKYPYLRDVLRHTTFYRYKLINRGLKPIEKMWFGFFIDTDLGQPSDDYVGSDSTLGLGFAYNGDDFDEDDISGGYVQVGTGYGTSPPALGMDFFRGPIIDPDGEDNDGDGEVDEFDERAGMTKFIVHTHDGSVQDWPGNAYEAYLLMSGHWRDGSPMTEGGWGYGGDKPVDFMFPGNPPYYWSEEDDCSDEEYICRNTPTDMHFNASTGPFTILPGGEQEVVLGIIWSQGENRFDSIYKLKREDVVIQEAIDMLLEPRLPVVERVVEIPKHYSLVHNYPNPFAGVTTFSYDLPADDTVLLRVYDVLGRVVETLVDTLQPAGRYEIEFDGTGLSPGVYFYRFTTSCFDGAHRMVLMR